MKRIIVAIFILIFSGHSLAWEYEDHKDGMRGTEIKTARVLSNNVEFFGVSRRAASLYILLRGESELGQAAMLHITAGQFDCSRRSGCMVSAKFDDGDIVSYTAKRGGPGNTDWIFINKRLDFEDRLKKASKLILEVPLWRYGNQQFVFDVEGLLWP